MSRGERLATFVGIGTSLVTVVISLIELPKDPKASNVWLALFASVVIIVILVAYIAFSSSTRRSSESRKDRDRKQQRTEEEKRLRIEFPAIFAFIESIGEIHSERDFEQFVTRLNHLLEIERRARGIKWSEVKDIETMKAIAYARLVGKKSDCEV